MPDPQESVGFSPRGARRVAAASRSEERFDRLRYNGTGPQRFAPQPKQRVGWPVRITGLPSPGDPLLWPGVVLEFAGYDLGAPVWEDGEACWLTPLPGTGDLATGPTLAEPVGVKDDDERLILATKGVPAGDSGSGPTSGSAPGGSGSGPVSGGSGGSGSGCTGTRTYMTRMTCRPDGLPGHRLYWESEDRATCQVTSWYEDIGCCGCGGSSPGSGSVGSVGSGSVGSGSTGSDGGSGGSTPGTGGPLPCCADRLGSAEMVVTLDGGQGSFGTTWDGTYWVGSIALTGVCSGTTLYFRANNPCTKTGIESSTDGVSWTVAGLGCGAPATACGPPGEWGPYSFALPCATLCLTITEV